MRSEFAKKLMDGMDKFFALLNVEATGNPWNDISAAGDALANMEDDDTLAANFILEFFHNYDTNKDNNIDSKEFDALIKDISIATGTKISDEQIAKAFATVGAERDSISSSQLNAICGELNVLGQEVVANSDDQSNASGYTKNVSEKLFPVFDLFQIKPSGNLYKDIVTLTSQLDGNAKRFKELVLTYIFIQYDKDGNETIELDEMLHLVRDYTNISRMDIEDDKLKQVAQQLVTICDVNKDGGVSLSELLQKWKYAEEQIEQYQS